MRPPLLLVTLALAGCVELGGVERIGPDTYRIGVKATTDEAAGELAERAALAAADDYCRAEGKRMTRTVSDATSLDIRTTHGAISRGDDTITFRCR